MLTLVDDLIKKCHLGKKSRMHVKKKKKKERKKTCPLKFHNTHTFIRLLLHVFQHVAYHVTLHWQERHGESRASRAGSDDDGSFFRTWIKIACSLFLVLCFPPVFFLSVPCCLSDLISTDSDWLYRTGRARVGVCAEGDGPAVQAFRGQTVRLDG